MDIQHSKFKRICVFCGSSPGKKTSYQDAAIQLGQELVCNNVYLYYIVFLPTFFIYITEFKSCIWIFYKNIQKKKNIYKLTLMM